MDKLKVVFLDVDGVLNCDSTEATVNGYLFVDDDKVERLARIIKSTGAKIVVSSDWRYDHNDPSYKALKAKLSDYGMPVFSETDVLGSGTLTRQREIMEWADTRLPDDYVILEDYWPMPRLATHLVKVDAKVGLTDEDVETAIAILNRGV